MVETYKKLNDEADSEKSTATLIELYSPLTNKFSESFKDVRNIHISKEILGEERREEKEGANKKFKEAIEKDLTNSELLVALRYSKQRTEQVQMLLLTQLRCLRTLAGSQPTQFSKLR